jgi:hypothetical protein
MILKLPLLVPDSFETSSRRIAFHDIGLLAGGWRQLGVLIKLKISSTLEIEKFSAPLQQ